MQYKIEGLSDESKESIIESFSDIPEGTTLLDLSGNDLARFNYQTFIDILASIPKSVLIVNLSKNNMYFFPTDQLINIVTSNPKIVLDFGCQMLVSPFQGTAGLEATQMRFWLELQGRERVKTWKAELAKDLMNEILGVKGVSHIVESYLLPTKMAKINQFRENLPEKLSSEMARIIQPCGNLPGNLTIDQKESKESMELTRGEQSGSKSKANPGSNRYSCFQAAKVAAVVTTVAAAGLCLISSQL